MLSHVRLGSGPALVLIHGLGSRRQVWDPILPVLARDHDVIALDLPGFGESPWPATASPGRGSVGWFADQVAAFLGELDVRTFTVAGSSLGGGVALELGRRGLAGAVTAFAPIGFWGAPGRRWCQGVVTAARVAATRLDPALPRILSSTAGRAAFCALFYGRPGRLDPADALASARALAAAPGFAGARDAFGDLPPWSFAGAGALPRIPVTVAWGTRDAVLPCRTQARQARNVLPTARHVLLPGCGHLPFADDPERCAALLSP
jgi:pimeloyl-ACP methyl ester carboxylesterase